MKEGVEKAETIKKRITFDELFALQVIIYAMRSACLKYKVGAVFVKEKRILTGGYNGPPKGEENCNEAGCDKKGGDGKILPAGSGLCRGAHAEMNAIVNFSAGGGGSLRDSAVYCIFSPCLDCAKHLVNLGIKEFVYIKEYKEIEGQRALELLKRRGIMVRKFSIEKTTLEEIFRNIENFIG